MITTEDLAKLDRKEKLRLLEAIWADLAQDPTAVESPSWHDKVLKETESRYHSGEEKPVDWDEAKRDLREKS